MCESELITKISDDTGFDKETLKYIFDIAKDFFVKGIIRDGNVIIKNIGTFRIVDIHPGHAYNFKTGDIIKIDRINTVRFRIADRLRRQVNEFAESFTKRDE